MPNPVALQFPMGGINEDAAYAGAPGLVVPRADLCLNVQPYDVHEERRRGGQRPPLEKYFASAVNGSNQIDRMIQANAALDPDFVAVGSVLTTDNFPYSDGDLDTVSSSAYVLRSKNNTGPPLDTGSPAAPERLQVVSNKVEPKTNDDLYEGAVGLTNLAPATGAYILRLTCNVPSVDPNPTYGQVGMVFRCDQTFAAENYFIVGVRFDTGGSAKEDIVVYRIDAGVPTVALTTTDITGAITASTDFVLELRITSSKLFVFIDNIQKVALTIGTNHGTERGFGMYCTGTGCNNMDSLISLASANPSALRQTNIVITTGGNIYNSIDGLDPVIAGGGTSAVASGRQTGIISAFQTAYFADGFASSYQQMPLETKQVTDWKAAVTAGALPAGGQGSIEFTVSSVDTSAKTITVTPTTTGEIAVGDMIEWTGSSGDPDNDGSYRVTATTGTVLTVATSTINNNTAAGIIKKADNACSLIALYSGRVVLSGLSTDPHNWFMSKAGNPLDWDYFEATSTVETAIAGSNNVAGKIEDIITALIPHGDDLLIFGGDHSMWRMGGDPGAGGRLDNISRSVGVLQAFAWTWDDKNVLWWVSREGFYRMAALGGDPKRVSEKRLDAIFGALDYGSNRINLQYNPKHDGIHIIIQPLSQPASAQDNFWYCIRTNSFWRVQYPVGQIPTATLLFDADAAADRAILFGSYDSVIRNVGGASSTQSDDGTAIDSFVSFPILTPGVDQAQFQIDDMQLTLEKDANGGTLEWYREDTPEEVAVSTTVQFTKTIVAGRNIPVRKKLRGQAIRVRVRNNTLAERWAYESGTVAIKGVGRQRKGL